MSSSSLSLIPPMTSNMESDAIPPRPVPRRTYGRARPVSPESSIDQPSSITDIPSLAASSKPLILNPSPAKSLLNRWSTSNTSWRESLAKLDAPGTDDNEKDEDVEEAKRMMERMRREARGEYFPDPVTSISKDLVKASSDGAPVRIAIPGPRLAVSFSSSSLTSLPPTSPSPASPASKTFAIPALPVSRPIVPVSSEADDETFPIRKSGAARASGQRRRIVTSEDEDDNEKSDKETPAQADRTPRKAKAKVRRSPSDSPTSSSSTENGKGHASSPRRDNFDHFMSTLGDEDDGNSEGEMDHTKRSTPPPADSVGLFDDDDEETTSRHKATSKPRGPKPLNKKDMLEVHKDIERAKRDRPVAPYKAKKSAMPISQWLTLATAQLENTATTDKSREAVPGLTYAESLPSSPAQPTPADEITSFSSTSHPRSNIMDSTSRAPIEDASSSPTPQTSRKPRPSATVIPATSEEGDEVLPDITQILEEDRKNDELKEMVRMKALILAEKKAAAIKALGSKPVARTTLPTDDFDDELVFEESPVKPRKTVTIAVPNTVSRTAAPGGRKFPDAKAVLNKSSEVPAISKQRQQMLRRAGKTAKPKDTSEISETYLDIAGKTFKHADAKILNGGSVPVGQKKGRDVVIARDKVEEMLKARHQEQVLIVRRKKEDEYGRIRQLPQKQAMDKEALMEMAESLVARDQRVQDDAEDEDEYDDDFNPDSEGEDEEEDVTMRYSGEESGAEEEAGSDAQEEDDKENRPPSPVARLGDGDDEDDESIPLRRKARTSGRVAFDSDDEDIVSRPRLPLAPAPAAFITPTEVPTLINRPSTPEINLSGFGGSGSPGFSQLFGETQAGDDDTDGFAGLRVQGEAGLLPSHLLLPEVIISKTQVERDNALIAAEAEEPMDITGPMVEVNQQRYLNDQGFFTQTKPVALSATQVSDDDSQPVFRPTLAGRSDVSLAGVELGSSTQLSETSPLVEAESMDESMKRQRAVMFSPTQDENTLTRLKRRSSRTSEPEDEGRDEVGDPSPSPPPRNVFTTLMAAGGQMRSKPSKIRPRSNLVDEQAEESDEDAGWGPVGGAGDKDDEGDDGEEDGFLEDLVDDQAIGEEEKKMQDELATEKAREMQRLDDQKREEQAKKITAGEMRVRRRGQDFFSDEEGDDEEGKPRRLSKKMRKKRRLDREDGLEKLVGEENAFLKTYEEDLESDIEDIEGSADEEMEEETQGSRNDQEDLREPRRNGRDTWNLLRERARMNRGLDPEEQTELLDKEIGLGDAAGSGLGDWEIDTVEEESQFFISKGRYRSSTSIVIGEEAAYDSRSLARQTSTHSIDHLQKFISDESQITRRAGGVTGGISVVLNKSMPVAQNSGRFGPRNGQASRQGSASARSNAGSRGILMQKTGKFAS